MDYSSFPTPVWDEKHLKALLHLHHYPVHLIQVDPWQTWIEQRGGFERVLDHLRSAPFPPNQEQIFHLILAHPNASARFYYSKLNISPSAYFTRLNSLTRTLLLQLNSWKMGAPKPAAKPSAPTNLPSALTPLIGAEKSLKDLLSILQRPAVRLLTLTGPGGVGKTRLAMAAGAALLQDFEDGVFFVPLETITDPALLVTQIARSLNVETLHGKSKPLFDALKTHLREPHTLLILDNFEQLIQSAGIVVELLQSTSNLKILVTSREALNIYGETRYTVPELPRPDPDNLPPLEQASQWPALNLFVQRVQARHPEFIVNETNLESIVHICDRLDGLPLAIELAAAQVRLLGPDQALPQLGYELKTLKDPSRNRSSRQKTLWGAIDWSYQLLPDSEKTIFTHLAVFGREWSLEAAQAVCKVDDLLSSLEDLVDKSLLRYVGQGREGNARFQMLQPVREYALDRLVSSTGIEQTQRCHAIYFLEMAQRAEVAMGGPEQLNWIHRIKQERENLQIALQWMWDKEETEMAFNLLGPLWRYYNMLNMWDETKVWLDRVLARGADLKSAGKVKALWSAAWLANHYNDFERAMLLAEEGLALARKIGDPRLIGLLLQNMADGLRRRGQYDQVMPLLEESLSLFRQMDDKEESAWTLYHIATTLIQRREYTQAREVTQDGLAIFRAINHQWGISATVWLTSVIALEDGNITLAIAAATERVSISRAIGARLHISQSLYDLALILWGQKEFEKAKTAIEESLTLSREIRDQAGAARALQFLGRLALQRSDPATARGFFEQAHAIYKKIGDPDAVANILTEIERVIS